MSELSASLETVPWSELECCRGCTRAALTGTPLALDPMPLAGHFPGSANAARTAGTVPLTWVVCTACGLVQVLEDVDDSHLYGEYNYSSSAVPALRRHFIDLAELLVERYDRPQMLEIGCNDGVLLKALPANWALTGCDPSDVARRAADGASYDLWNEPLTRELVERNGAAGHFDLITGSNCLAHMSDISETFAAASLALRTDGELIVEVHDLHETIRGAQWDTIYHEHKVEWSAGSLVACLRPHGLEVVSVDRLPLHGGLLRVVARKTAASAAPETGVDLEDLRKGLSSLNEAYARRTSAPSYKLAMAATRAGLTVAGYGASGRANVWLNQLPDLDLKFVVDDSPLRAGRWVPRQAFPILSASVLDDQEMVPSLMVVTAWNYFDDIVRKNSRLGVAWVPSVQASRT